MTQPTDDAAAGSAAGPPPSASYPPAGYPGAGPQPGTGHAGQPYLGYPPAGQPYPGQPPAGQPYPGQPYPGQPFPGYPPARQWPAPGLGPAGQPLASFGDRLLAHLVDWAILVAATLVLLAPVVLIFVNVWGPRLTEAAGPYGQEPDPTTVLTELLLPMLLLEAGLVVLILAVYYVYHVELMFRSGQTVGKKVMRLRVVPMDPAATLTRGAAAKRWAVEYVVAMFVPLLSLLDGLWQLWDKPYQQCLHDRAASTIVIKVTG